MRARVKRTRRRRALGPRGAMTWPLLPGSRSGGPKLARPGWLDGRPPKRPSGGPLGGFSPAPARVTPRRCDPFLNRPGRYDMTP